MPKTYRELIDLVEKLSDGVPTIKDITITPDGTIYQRLDEGKWVSGRFEQNVRIDQPTHLHGDGEPHGHVFGRNGEQVVVVNLCGTGSHGSKGRLHRKDADALRKRGFTIRKDRLVEWYVDDAASPMLLG